MKIIFKDYLDNEISEAQSKTLDEYSKEFLAPNGSVKKQETYFKQTLERIDYYKSAAETDDEAREQLKLYGVDYSIRQRERFNNDFIIISVDSYTGNLLAAKWKFLADTANFIMCTQAIDLESGVAPYEQTTKYLGEYSNDLEPNYCKFNYDSEGNLTYCDHNYVRDYESEIIELDRMPLIKDRFKLNDKMYNYYLRAEFLPPLK